MANVKCASCGTSYSEGAEKCPSCGTKMSAQQKAESKAEAAFQAAAPPAGAPLLAARVGDPHVCPQVTVLVPHVGGVLGPPGVPTVLIGGMPAATLGNLSICVGPPGTVAKGSTTVLIGGRPAARMTDQTAHGGIIVMGCPLVMIGG